MNQVDKDILLRLLRQHESLGISQQIDYQKFYLYSIITHSTAIEGSTVTEVEAQLLFDEGITSSKRTIVEQMMNLDLKAAYEYGMEWMKRHEDITTEWLVSLAAKVMARTGAEYHSPSGDFSAAKGELRKLNVTAGLGGRSYMSYLKVPQRLETFCNELNRRRRSLDKTDVAAIYELSFWAHYELVTIHPWADGNGRMSRLLMNLLQMEYGVLPTKVLKEDKAEYIQSLIDTREQEDVSIFARCMTKLHCAHLRHDIEQYERSIDTEKGTQEEEKSTQETKASTQEIILSEMRKNPKITRNELAEIIGITPDGIKKQLDKLRKAGIIKHIGSTKAGEWVVIQDQWG